MRFFNSPPSKKLLSVDASATELLALARVQLDPTKVALITSIPCYVDAVHALIYRTKVAIIGANIRTAAMGKQPEAREYSIVDAFGDLAILSLPFDERQVLLSQLQDLMSRLGALEDTMAIRGKDLRSIAIPRWCKEWLSTAVDDDELVTRTSRLFGVHLSTYVHGEMLSLKKLAYLVLYGI